MCSKLVESWLIPCLDEGSNPSGSTINAKAPRCVVGLFVLPGSLKACFHKRTGKTKSSCEQRLLYCDLRSGGSAELSQVKMFSHVPVQITGSAGCPQWLLPVTVFCSNFGPVSNTQWINYRPLKWIFYGNFFYGLCAVAQAVEATLQQRVPLNPWYFYVILFVATVLFYNYPYARKYSSSGNNPRTAWYMAHYKFLYRNQVVFSGILLGAFVLFIWYYIDAVEQMNLVHWLLAATFPVVAALYYGSNFLSSRYNLRSIGWLKPFVIGFTWAGLVVIYPVLYYTITHGQAYVFTTLGAMLFFKNLLFISVLCIMFDIKDYASDHALGLKTFVVQLGLRRTIVYILLPLSTLGLLAFVTYAHLHQFNTMRILLNMVPFVLLLFTVYSLRRRRTLMYYLVIIDGLMLVKAACGITAMLLS